MMITAAAAAAGIGASVEVTPAETFMIRDVTENSPAQKAGLKTYDLIISVQADAKAPVVPTEGKKLEEVVALVRGPLGTPVILMVRKPSGDTVTLKIPRDLP